MCIRQQRLRFRLWWPAFLPVVAALVAGCGGQAQVGMGKELPPLPILPPSALVADAGNGKAYLRWNLQIEDPRVVGWKVLEAAPEARTLTPQVLAEPQWVAAGLQNGAAYTFAVVGVLKDGGLTPPSNTVTVRPRDVGTAKVQPLGEKTKMAVGRVADVSLGRQSVRVVFPDGQELVYDRLRPIDWKARDGEHLVYPRHFGNGLDIGKFDARGLPMVIPPDGLERDSLTVGGETWMSPGGKFKYRDVQFGFKHPYLTDPVTLPLEGPIHGDARVTWFPPQVEGDRVTFHWWQPLVLAGYRSWNFVEVWETWWPIERDRHGTTYHGLAREIEVAMPEAWKTGFQVMINNGFGPGGGSRDGVTSYNTGFRKPTHEVVHFSGDKNRQVIFQGPKLPRQGIGYHPDQDCLQGSPLIFLDWGKGSLTIAARRLYYHGANNTSSYVEQGADGVWPNLAWDLGTAPKRTAVETVEYLYTSAMAQPLPQRYMNARMEALGDVSRRMGVQDDVPAAAVSGTLGAVKGDGGPVAHAEKWIPKLKQAGVDGFHIYHDFWHAVPATVDDAWRLDERHGANPEIKAMCDRFHEAGVSPGFWYRPEVVKTSAVMASSQTIPTAGVYYGYAQCRYPEVVPLLRERGIPIFREHPEWVRCQADGAWPVRTHYQWVPMSMAGQWWDRVMWPTLVTSRRLGFDWILMDGGFGGLAGVDYAPMRLGKADGAVPCQPYWWRVFRSMKAIGMRNFGECTLGWKGGFVNQSGPGDEHFIWMYQASCITDNQVLTAPEQVHQLFQLYNGVGGVRNMLDGKLAPVFRYAARFFRGHRSPDWIEFKDLRQGEPREATIEVPDTWMPTGGPSDVVKEGKYTFTVSPWTWGDVVWHYDDGTQAVYPAYEKVDWSKE
jgi:hypothetical protein